jgi:hypothetical protein
MKKTVVSSLVFALLVFGWVSLGHSGLIEYYPFNGNPNDASGNNLNGTGYGVSYTTNQSGQSNSAVYFDGSSSYVQIPYPGALSQGTVGAWVYAASLPNPYPDGGTYWLSFGDGDLDGFNFGVHPGYSPNLAFGIFGGWNWANSGVPWTTGQWNYLTGQWGPAGLKIFINGTFMGSDPSYTGGIPSWATLAYLGVDSWGPNYFNGAIDDLVIYDQVLSTSQIQSLYSGASPLSIDSVPEPCTMLLLGSGLAGLATLRKKFSNY